MKRNARKEPKRIPANYLRRQVYAYILKVGYQEFVDQWQHSFEPTAVNNTQLNILVFCAANVEPLHQKTYREQAEETTYIRTFKRISVIEICSGRFMTNYNGSNVEAQFWNVEYTALLRGAFLARTIRQEHDNTLQSNDEGENVLAMEETQHEQVSEKPVTVSMERSVSGLRVFRLYEEFMKQVAELRKETWFHDVTFSLASGNSVNTETISSKEAADTLAMFIDQNTISTEEAQLRDLISETFALNGKDDVVGEICKIIKSAR